jgi:hypothetical protein
MIQDAIGRLGLCRSFQDLGGVAKEGVHNTLFG